MSKAILVLDEMPGSCYECDFLDDDGDYPMCRITTEVCGYSFKTYKNKMNKCPLKQLPKKHVRDYPGYDGYITGWDDGWDACLDEILGE